MYLVIDFKTDCNNTVDPPSEGGFYRSGALDINQICGGSPEISMKRVPLSKPEFQGDIKKIDVDVGVGMDAGV